MTYIQTLTQNFRDKYQAWLGKQTDQNQQLRAHLATEGQAPPAMIIACCDSRLPSSDLFGGETGSSFLYRNIANLVPPANQSGHCETAAAVEYAVKALKVAHIMVLGHSRCGGVQGCLHHHEQGPQALEGLDNVAKWVDVLTPAYKSLKESGETITPKQLEQAGIVMSLHNLLTYDFVAEACDAGKLVLHGLWFDISSAELHSYHPETDQFENLT